MSISYLKTFDLRFYKTKVWKEKRKEILIRDNNECQLCKKAGKVEKATTVHHIEHYEKRPDLALTDNNLVSVCESCHNKLHPEKGFGQSSKIKLLKFHKERWR